MAYQKVATPRFYIDQIQYLKSSGFDFKKAYLDEGFTEEFINNGENTKHSIIQDSEVFTFEPNIQKNIISNNGIDSPDDFLYWVVPTGYLTANELNSSNIGRYVAFLNHDIGSRNFRGWFNWFDNSNVRTQDPLLDSIINFDSSTHQISNNGCSIFELKKDFDGFNPDDNYKNMARIGVAKIETLSNDQVNEVNIGALSWGTYYDMPHSPELDITMEIEFDGFDTIKTLGGATMTNVRYAGSPWWYDVDANKVEPWAVGDSAAITKRNGRRTWTMKFSYLDQKNLLSSNYMSNHYMENNSGYDSNNLGTNENDEQQFYFNIDNDDSFVSQVLNKVGNGQRFIFQPDNTANNPSDFAIAMLDQDSLQIKQVANGVYDISLKITEVW